MIVLSNFAVPSNSAVPVNVVTPATLTLSKFVCPSTSKSPFASIAPVNVEIPVALKLRTVKSGPIKPLPGADTILSACKFLHRLVDEPRSYVLSTYGTT